MDGSVGSAGQAATCRSMGALWERMGGEDPHETCKPIPTPRIAGDITADWGYLDHQLLRRISNRIINEVRGIHRVVLDISSKTPATIDW